MGSQLVDLNADGQRDFLTASYSGAVYVSWGSALGFQKPEYLRDAKGSHIALGWFLPDTRAGDDAKLQSTSGDHLTSALAFDWDNDGDFDLLLSDKKKGYIYLKMNEGSAKHPAFSSEHSKIKAGGEIMSNDTGITTPKLVDWNKDGLTDLVVGTYGTYSDGGAGVYLYRNVGKVGAPEFAARETILTGTKPAAGSDPAGPEQGLYPDVCDLDGDGDLDLVVGGRSMVYPEKKELTAEEEARLKECQQIISEGLKEMNEIRIEVSKQCADIKDPAEQRKKTAELLGKHERYQEVMKAYREAWNDQRTLQPTPTQLGHVWLYTNTEFTPKATPEASESEKEGDTAESARDESEARR